MYARRIPSVIAAASISARPAWGEAANGRITVSRAPQATCQSSSGISSMLVFIGFGRGSQIAAEKVYKLMQDSIDYVQGLLAADQRNPLILRAFSLPYAQKKTHSCSDVG
jgi:hypothetical protein